MERIIKYFKYVLMFVCLSSVGFCNELIYQYTTTPSVSSLVSPQNVPFSNCTKEYEISQEKLYYLTIASINANKFEIAELQSKTGYVLFRAVNKEFLAAVVKLGNNKSMLKITPTNNHYYFAPGIVSNIFRYIDLNVEEKITPIKML